MYVWEYALHIYYMYVWEYALHIYYVWEYVVLDRHTSSVELTVDSFIRIVLRRLLLRQAILRNS